MEVYHQAVEYAEGRDKSALRMRNPRHHFAPMRVHPFLNPKRHMLTIIVYDWLHFDNAKYWVRHPASLLLRRNIRGYKVHEG